MRALDAARSPARSTGAVGELDRFLAGAVQQHLLGRGRQVLERRLDVEAIVARNALEHREGVGVAAVPSLDRARGHAEFGERHDAGRVEGRDLAQPVAGGAGTDRRVEREQPGLQLRQRVAARRTAESAAETVLHGIVTAVHLERQRPPIGDPQCGLEALGQALAHVGSHPQAVDDDVDVVLFGLLQCRQRFGLEDRHRGPARADPEPHVAARLHVGKQVGELTLAVAHDRRQDHEPGALGQRERGVHHLAHALCGQRQTMVGAVGRAGARVEQAQVVVDLGHRAHGRARVVRRGLLLDADGRRQAFDEVDVGLVHQLQELARVGRQALDVAALAFGVQRVEGQARLARTRQAGDHDQRVLGDVEVDVLQVVRARAAHPDHGRVVRSGGGGGHRHVAGQPTIISATGFASGARPSGSAHAGSPARRLRASWPRRR